MTQETNDSQFPAILGYQAPFSEEKLDTELDQLSDGVNNRRNLRAGISEIVGEYYELLRKVAEQKHFQGSEKYHPGLPYNNNWASHWDVESKLGGTGSMILKYHKDGLTFKPSALLYTLNNELGFQLLQLSLAFKDEQLKQASLYWHNNPNGHPSNLKGALTNYTRQGSDQFMNLDSFIAKSFTTHNNFADNFTNDKQHIHNEATFKISDKQDPEIEIKHEFSKMWGSAYTWFLPGRLEHMKAHALYIFDASNDSFKVDSSRSSNKHIGHNDFANIGSIPSAEYLLILQETLKLTTV